MRLETREQPIQPIDCLILDNTAFVSGFNLNTVMLQYQELRVFLTSEIYEEAYRNPRSRQIIAVAEAQNILAIQDPSADALQQVQKAATASGDIGALSHADQSLMALCVDLQHQHPEWRILLMSDDYSVQNVSPRLQISIFRFQKAGIKRTHVWQVYCPQCFRTYPPAELGMECEWCGATLKRKKKKKRKKRKTRTNPTTL